MSDEDGRPDEPELEIGVSFRRNPKIYSFKSCGMRLSIGDRVLVRTEKGVDIAQIMEIKGRVPAERTEELLPIVRKATADDLQHLAEQEERERQALKICGEKIAEHELPMKLIDASLSFDNTRLVFFFSADGRVDFRELVRDLARTFRMRIELRQIGVRDEAKLLGGLGPCGRRLCCKTFMREFEPVGIRVAKDQGLALNPNKISGLCDRLMCCLLFEHQTYLDLQEALPKRGDRVSTEHGPGTVREVALLKHELQIELDDGSEVKVAADAVRPLARDSGRGGAVRRDSSEGDRAERAEQPDGDRQNQPRRRGGSPGRTGRARRKDRRAKPDNAKAGADEQSRPKPQRSRRPSSRRRGKRGSGSGGGSGGQGSGDRSE